jgi:hypothetical protein
MFIRKGSRGTLPGSALRESYELVRTEENSALETAKRLLTSTWFSGLSIVILAVLSCAIFPARAQSSKAGPQYRLVFSADIDVCKPLLSIINPPIVHYRSAAYGEQPYFRDVQWKNVRYRRGGQEQAKQLVSTDIDGDGINELIVPFFAQLGGDDRATWLEVVQGGARGRDNVLIAEELDKTRLWKIEPGLLALSKLARTYPAGTFSAARRDKTEVIDNIEYTNVNDFEMLSSSGRLYVSMRTHVVGENQKEISTFRRWLIVASMTRPGNRASALSRYSPLNEVLDPVCMFVIVGR